MRKFAFGHWLMVAALACGLSAAAIAAPPHKVTPAAQKKDTPKKEAPKKDEPNISAPHAILIDAQYGGVLFERDADRLIFPASLAKLMTAEYVFHEIKEGRIKLTDEYMVSENAWRKGGAPSHGSTMFAALYSKVSVDDLLRGMIIQSANDACIVLAEGIAGNEAEFGNKLTQRAREIGLEKSVFTNSNGLPDPNEKVTTRELAMLARHVIRTYPDFYPLFAQPDFTWNKIRQQNRNPLLGAMNGADGLKTGYTKEAGYGLVGSAVQNELRLIVAVTGVQHSQGTRRRSKESARMGFPEFRAAHDLCRRPDDWDREGLWRRKRPRRAEGRRRGQGDAAQIGGGPADCSYRLHRAGAGAGDRRNADRKSQGLAQRQLDPDDATESR